MRRAPAMVAAALTPQGGARRRRIRRQHQHQEEKRRRLEEQQQEELRVPTMEGQGRRRPAQRRHSRKVKAARQQQQQQRQQQEVLRRAAHQGRWDPRLTETVTNLQNVVGCVRICGDKGSRFPASFWKKVRGVPPRGLQLLRPRQAAESTALQARRMVADRCTRRLFAPGAAAVATGTGPADPPAVTAEPPEGRVRTGRTTGGIAMRCQLALTSMLALIMALPASPRWEAAVLQRDGPPAEATRLAVPPVTAAPPGRLALALACGLGLPTSTAMHWTRGVMPQESWTDVL
jgi:hypothetical protein